MKPPPDSKAIIESTPQPEGDRWIDRFGNDGAVDEPDADGKRPFWCHCGDCGHDFAPFWVPMPVNDMPKDYRCPRCRSKRSFAGKNPAGA